MHVNLTCNKRKKIHALMSELTSCTKCVFKLCKWLCEMWRTIKFSWKQSQSATQCISLFIPLLQCLYLIHKRSNKVRKCATKQECSHGHMMAVKLILKSCDFYFAFGATFFLTLMLGNVRTRDDTSKYTKFKNQQPQQKKWKWNAQKIILA